jgi:transmembrane sensor
MKLWSSAMSACDSAAGMEDTSPRAVASRWYIRMTGDKVPGEMKSDFQRWLEEHPEHQAAYRSVVQTQVLAGAAGEHPRILALRHKMALRLTRRNTRGTRTSIRIAAAAAAVAGAVGLAAVLDVPGWLRGEGRYSTTLGERVVIALADESHMTLNTRTRVKTAFSEKERRVILKEGQALFEVTKDVRRPFIVEAAGREFVALGTAFDVRMDGDRIQVTMVEGSVKVPTTRDAAEAVVIKAGDQLTVAQSLPHSAPRAIGSEGVGRAISWREGRVIFEETPLSEAVAELNRYSEQKLILENPELGRFRISGTFITGKVQTFVEAATVYFPVEVARSDRRGITLRVRQ